MRKYIWIGIIVVIIVGYSVYLNQVEHSPSGDKCKIDDDCVCTLKCDDCCGKVGQSWKCVNNKCELGFDELYS